LAGRSGLRLDFNENTSGCSPRVLERLRSITPEDLARYPERAPVERLLADHLQLQPDEVLLTNGVDEAIHLLCETYLDPDSEVLIPVPTFAMYEVFAAATGATIRKVPYLSDFRFPAEQLLEEVTARTRLIAVANPNNPTGSVVSPGILVQLAQQAPQAAVLVDEAYFEFYGESLIGASKEIPNLFVARTFSKAYGLAGLRAGILVGNESSMRDVRRVASPYSVNNIALACLPVAIADQEYVQAYAREVREQRSRLQSQLADWGLRYWSSQANFVLFEIGPAHRAFVATMRDRGILVRDRSSDPGCDGCVRITVGLRAQTDRLIETMHDVLTELSLTRERIAQ